MTTLNVSAREATEALLRAMPVVAASALPPLGSSYQPVAEEPVAEERDDGLVERVLTDEDLARMIDAELPERAAISPWSPTGGPEDEVRVVRGSKGSYTLNAGAGCVAGHCIGPDGWWGAGAEKAVATLALKALLDLDEDVFHRIAGDEYETTDKRLTRARRRQRSR